MRFRTQLLRLLPGDDGVTGCEYAILLSLGVAVLISAVRTLGPAISTIFTLTAGDTGLSAPDLTRPLP